MDYETLWENTERELYSEVANSVDYFDRYDVTTGLEVCLEREMCSIINAEIWERTNESA